MKLRHDPALPSSNRLLQGLTKSVANDAAIRFQQERLGTETKIQYDPRPDRACHYASDDTRVTSMMPGAQYIDPVGGY